MSAAGALLLVALLATASPADYNDAARAYSKGDYAAAYQEYRALAEAGDVRAQANVGWMYQAGEGTPRDPVQAAAWYARAAEHGHEVARYNLGYLYEEGVPRDLAKAGQWYGQAAQQGSAEAKAACARVQKLLAAQGAPPGPSPLRAKPVPAVADQLGAAGRAAAARQDPLPVVPGAGLEKGELNQRVARARLAAEGGDLDAIVYLGWCFSSGSGVPRNKTEAMVWYRLAGARGRVDAQLALGWMYYLGEGEGRDLSESAAWYRMAARQGNLKARQMLRKMARGAGGEGSRLAFQTR